MTTRRISSFAPVAAALLVFVAGPAFAQESADDCYPIPAEGCDVASDGGESDGGAEPDEGVEVGGEQQEAGDVEVESVATVDASAGELARTGVPLATWLGAGLALVLLGGLMLVKHRRA